MAKRRASKKSKAKIQRIRGARETSKKLKTRIVKAKPTEVLHVELPKAAVPLLYHKKNVVTIVPVPIAKKQTWTEFLFGTEKF